MVSSLLLISAFGSKVATGEADAEIERQPRTRPPPVLHERVGVVLEIEGSGRVVERDQAERDAAAQLQLVVAAVLIFIRRGKPSRPRSRPQAHRDADSGGHRILPPGPRYSAAHLQLLFGLA